MNEVVIYTRQTDEGARMPVNGANPLPTYTPNIASSTNSAVDAFGRGRVSQPTTIFDSQPQYDKQPLLWDEKIGDAASATHLPNESAVELAVTNAAASSVIRQTKEYFRYQPGKSQLILCTFVMGAPVDDVLKLVGYGDDDNGMFMGQDGAGTFMLLRSNVTGSVDDSRKFYQADWNVDPMDGTGPSGYTLDTTKAQILVIDLEWLGVGRVRMGLNIDGTTFYVHEFLNANVLDSTYTTTANLPIRYQLSNTAPNGGPATMKQICC